MLISIHNLACMYTWVYFVSLSLARVLEGFFSPQDNIRVTFKAMLFSSLNSFLLPWGSWGIKLKSSDLEAGRYLYHWVLFQPLLEFPKCWSSSHSPWSWFCSHIQFEQWEWLVLAALVVVASRHLRGSVIASSLPLLLKQTMQQVSDMPDWQTNERIWKMSNLTRTYEV